jgi:acyl phosphate:glycerol-3-phosphate acyltransferase
MHWAVFAIIGYLAGSIPFGLLFTRWAGLGDVRNIGSGNIGATNVLRTGNKKVAAATLLADALKGFFPVLAANYFAGSDAMMMAGYGAVAGHLLPVWLKFKGGKGVATGLGVMFGWSWILGLITVAAWVAVFAATKISSASALAAVLITTLVAMFWLTPVVGWWPVLVIAAAIWIMHRQNIQRLLKGEEPKSSFSKKT